MKLISSWEECLEHISQVEKELGISFESLKKRIQNKDYDRIKCSSCGEPLPSRHIHGDEDEDDDCTVPGFCSEGCAIKYAVDKGQLQGVTE